MERPFDAVRRALANDGGDRLTPVRLDPTRQLRSGVPEIILGGVKSPEEVAASLAALASANGRALATRLFPGHIDIITAELGDSFDLHPHPLARSLVAAARGAQPPVGAGRVGVITAGSSDAPIAAEAALVASEMGAAIHEVSDVGVSGLHRLVEPLERLIAADVDVIIVVAGMDGALPSVVAGLVAVPVIGLPTSTGYGYGGQGVAALMSMLQSCAPGLVVVNIDNGVGAGSTAALIANRAGAGRVARGRS